MAKQQITAIEANGRADGIEFNLTNAKYTNTFDAHRLAQFVKSKGDKELEQKVQPAELMDVIERNDAGIHYQRILQTYLINQILCLQIQYFCVVSIKCTHSKIYRFFQ